MKNVCKTVFITLVLIFLYAPILILTVYSFTDATTIGAIRGFSLHNYVTLFTTPELRDMIFGTITLALGAALLATVLGTLGAVGSFYSGKVSNSIITAVNQIPVVNADVVTGFSACILKQMDPSIYEAALDLGASPATALRKIVFPQISSGVFSGFCLAVTLSLDDYFIATYTKPATFDTISTYVVNATKGAQTEIKTALWALSAVIFLIVLLIVAAANFRASGSEAERSQV